VHAKKVAGRTVCTRSKTHARHSLCKAPRATIRAAVAEVNRVRSEAVADNHRREHLASRRDRAQAMFAARLGLLRERDEAISEGHRRNRSWAREHPDQRDGVWFQREIVPKLDAFSFKEIGRATGLSLAASSRIRAGMAVTPARHWEALAALLRA
jgi:hypothetical protein